MKSSGIGGQAVLEGVMMKNKDKYAVAVRKPDHEIVVELNEYHSIGEKTPFFKLPVIRGVVAFIESLTIGVKTLTFSASFFEDEETQSEGKEDSEKKEKKIPDNVMNALTVVIAIALAVGIFMVLPFFLSQLLNKVIDSQRLLTVFEGIIRIILFVGYILAISKMEDIKRVFMYHGAEHKVINCIENGYDLTVKNVRLQSKHHKRCGTSFTLDVVFLSVIFFMFINVSSPVLRLVLRLLLVPVIAGVSYEFIKLAGSSENKIVGILSKPGFWLQGLTTKEPNNSMIEVAIASVEAVFDWKAFLDENGRKGKKSAAARERRNERKIGKKVEPVQEEDGSYKKVILSEEEDELEGLDKLFTINSAEKEKEERERADRRQDSLRRKVNTQEEPRSTSLDLASTLEVEEEDEVLSALDKFLSFDNRQSGKDEE